MANTDYILKNAVVNCFKTKESLRDWLKKETGVDKNGIKDAQGNNRFAPILVRTNFFSFFNCLKDEAERGKYSKILGDDCGLLNDEELEKRKQIVKDNIERTQKKIENTVLNFLLNSSIWIRFCDNEDWDGTNNDTMPEGIKDSLEEFDWFKKLGLYDLKPAQEYIEYQARVQEDNYLVEIGGHGEHVTPMIYSNEVEFRDFFYGKKSPILFKYLEGQKPKKTGVFQTEDISLRILLVDDRIGKRTEKDCVNNKCSFCKGNPGTPDKLVEPCKLSIIRQLMSGDFIKEQNKRDIFKKRTYWADNVTTYFVKDLKINDVWRWDDTEKTLKPQKDKSKLPGNDFLNNAECVQIIGVNNLESALALMSCCKFDIILLDYLLGPKSDINPDRSYSTEMFEFLSYSFNEEVDQPDIVKTLKESNKFNDLQLKEFQNNVKLNRGPLDKYWIIPMTSYNSSFISDLQRKHVQLIDHRWNISQGADPVNTPWRFLHKLNEFIDLQLRSCIFQTKQLLCFIKYTYEDLKGMSSDKNKNLGFFEFQSFMGSEYADFMRRYGNRYLIQRDAVWEKNETENKSVFATCVWNCFYSKTEYRDVIELNRLIQRFLYNASIIHNDHNGRQRLEETFGQLCFFIDANKSVQDCIKDEDNGLKDFNFHANMLVMRNVMDELTAHSDNDKH